MVLIEFDWRVNFMSNLNRFIGSYDKKSKVKKKSYTVKTDLINRLNGILAEIANIRGEKGIKSVARSLGIPTYGGSVKTAQITGYIGVASCELRKLKKV